MPSFTVIRAVARANLSKAEGSGWAYDSCSIQTKDSISTHQGVRYLFVSFLTSHGLSLLYLYRSSIIALATETLVNP